MEDAGLFAVHGLEPAIRRGFHREQRNELEHVVLNHVAQAARSLVKTTTTGHAEILGQRDLDA